MLDMAEGVWRKVQGTGVLGSGVEPGHQAKDVILQPPKTTGDPSRGSRQPSEIRGCDHFSIAAWTSGPLALHQALPHAGKELDWVLAFVDLPCGRGRQGHHSTVRAVSGCRSVRESPEEEDQPGGMRGGQRLLEGSTPTLDGEP